MRSVRGQEQVLWPIVRNVKPGVDFFLIEWATMEWFLAEERNNPIYAI